MRNGKKVTAVGLTCVLAAGLLIGSVDYAAHTFAAENMVKAETVKAVEQTAAPKVIGGAEKEKSVIEKEESVYVTLDASGKQKKVIVSDWLKNSGINGEIEDVSDLSDIQNTKGNEKFTQNGNIITWEAGNEDIYYQGTTEAELPVSMKISYKLDGESVEPEELIGKSGKLEIKIQYINHSTQVVKAGKKKKEIFTPFLMATGMFLPVENFSNVKVDNGRVLSEGDNDIVAVYGMPGLKESLDLDNIDFGEDSDLNMDKINKKLTDSATITADVKDFEMGQTYTVVTPNFFNRFEFDAIEDVDELEDKLDDLTDASDKLVNGSKKIKHGTKKLDDNFDKYESAIKKLKNGVKSLDDGSKAIRKATKTYTEATDKILDAVGSYVDGTKTYAENEKKYDAAAKELVSGIGQLYSGVQPFPKSYEEFDGKLEEYTTGVNTLLSEENLKSMTDGVAALQSGAATINASASKLNQSKESVDTAIAGMEELVKNYKALAAVETDPTKQATYQAMVENLEKAVAGTKQYVEGAETFAAAVDAATNGKSDGAYDSEGKNDLAAGLSSLKTAADTMSGYAKTIRESKSPLMQASSTIKSSIQSVVSNLKKAKDGGDKLVKNNGKLKEGADALIKNAEKVKTNSKKLTSKSDDFRDATKKLEKGSAKLLSGVTTLVDKTGDVSEGIGKLADGTGDLYDGVKKFEQKGVLKLKNAMKDLLDGTEDLKDTAEAISQASKDYKSFSGISKDMDGNVKFIMTTDELRAGDDD